MKDEEIIKAITPPESPRLARRIYDFLNENSNLVTVFSGMSSVMTGFDRSKLSIVAKDYDIELGRYLPYVKIYESKMLDQQNES